MLFCYENYQKKAELQYEAQKQVEEMTEAEKEELAVRKRRAEGTPCNEQTFLEWKAKFEQEMDEIAKNEMAAAANDKKKKKEDKVVDKSGRITGYLQFSDKIGTLNLEAMEAAIDNAQVDEDEQLEVDEDLFDLDDDELDDLDDLDFDDDDDDDDDDDEPDI